MTLRWEKTGDRAITCKAIAKIDEDLNEDQWKGPKSKNVGFTVKLT